MVTCLNQFKTYFQTLDIKLGELIEIRVIGAESEDRSLEINCILYQYALLTNRKWLVIGDTTYRQIRLESTFIDMMFKHTCMFTKNLHKNYYLF